MLKGWRGGRERDRETETKREREREKRERGKEEKGERERGRERERERREMLKYRIHKYTTLVAKHVTCAKTTFKTTS